MGHTIERLDRVSRALNPFLLFVAVALVVLNLACVVNLIDWNNLPQTPTTAADSTAAGPSNTAPPASGTRTAAPSSTSAASN